MRFFANAPFTAIFSVVLLLLVQGCDSVVERTEPSTAVSQEVALTDPNAIQGIRASMYDRFHTEEMSTDWLLGPAAIADNTYFRANQGRHQPLNVNDFRNGIASGADGRSAYNDFYNAINDANILINGIEEGALPEARANKLEAEGRFIRALVLHHAVRIYGYDPDGEGGVENPNSGLGSTFNLGVEIRTEPTTSVSDAAPVPRSPVPAVYDQILSDLDAAQSLFQNLPGDVREGSAFYPSEAAVEALRARVQLYNRSWQAADDAATEAISLANAAFGSSLAPADSAGVRSIFDENNGNPEAIFTVDTDPQTESPGINEAISAYTTIQWLAQLPTQDLIDLYEPGDARLAGWYDPCVDEVNERVPEGCGAVNDAGFELKKYSSEQGVSRYADDYVHLRIGELDAASHRDHREAKQGGAGQQHRRDVVGRSVDPFRDDQFLREEADRVDDDVTQPHRPDLVDRDPVGERGGDLPFRPRSRDCGLREDDRPDENRTEQRADQITGDPADAEQIADGIRQCHRSTSPRTTSRLPSEAIRSGMYSPSDITSSDCRLQNAGERILNRAGLAVPSERM